MTAASPSGIGSATRTLPFSVGEALRELAEPVEFGTRVKVAIERAGRRAGLSYWRAFDIWYGKARRIEGYEADAIAEALHRKRKEAARNELYELRTRLARLEAMLALSDPDFHRADIDAARDQIGGLDGRGGSVARARAGR